MIFFAVFFVAVTVKAHVPFFFIWTLVPETEQTDLDEAPITIFEIL
jgi:hypothetical protein